MTGTATEVLGAIVSGTLDIGVVFTTPEPTPDTTGLDPSPVYDEQFVLIVPPDWSLSNRNRVSARDLAGSPMITFSPLAESGSSLSRN
jgi:DNA-binding transcriptional LysR family regulator